MKIIQFIKAKAIWFICVFSFFAAFTYNQINLQNLPQKLIRNNETVATNDDPSYLNPAKSYLAKGIWREGNIGKQSYFLRPPGYGILYYVVVKIFNPNNALKVLKIIQLLLFALAVYWFYFIAQSILKNRKLSLLLAAIYGFSPFAIGFLYYTLTEGITPSLLLLYVFLLFKAFQNTTISFKNLYYFLASLTFSYLFIVRPVLGIFSLLLAIFIVTDYWKCNAKLIVAKLFLFGSIAFSLMLIWQVRNYKIANKYVGLHPIYFNDNNSIYRPTFNAYWSFVEGWAQEGKITYAYMDPLWKNAIKGDTSIIYITKAIQSYPKNVVKYFGKSRLIKVLKKYQRAILFQKKYYSKNLPMPNKIPVLEQEVINELHQLTKEFKHHFWFQYHVIAPLKVFKTMAFNSNLSLFVFQKTFRGNWLMELTRFIFFALHSLCFLALIVNFIWIKKSFLISYALTLSLFIYVFYLCYFQRGIEERYTLPILPFLMIGLFNLSRNIYAKISLNDYYK